MLEKRGLGEIIFYGTKKAAEHVGSSSLDWAMQIKGLDISAYTCQAFPGMALAYATSPIGAHHKDAFLPSWELSEGDRFSYSKEKVEKVIEFQRIRGGLFEALTVCRLLWADLDFDLDWYLKFLNEATGISLSSERLNELGDRYYSLIRSFWGREFSGWTREMDVPPARWFDEPFKQGELKGACLDREKYEQMLTWYYEMRGWDQNGLPTIEALINLGLDEVAETLKQNG